MANIERSGLCYTCVNQGNCTFNNCPQQPVLQCEEFEGYPFVKKESIENSNLPKMNFSKIDENDESEYKGLCSNCENFKVCTFPKLEGGVWHCEEYE